MVKIIMRINLKKVKAQHCTRYAPDRIEQDNLTVVSI